MVLANKYAISLYKTMVKIRLFEERVSALGAQGYIRASYHLCVGQEAVAASACAALEEGDWITSTHRGHGHCIAKGGNLNQMMAELMGKATGYCKGKGGSMHIADHGIGILGANGIVGGGIPIAMGAGLATKHLGNGKVVICFFGDGAANQGCLYESMNMASIWKLPVIFLCENNLYGMTTPASEVQAGKIAKRSEGFAMPGYEIDGNDVISVYERVGEAIKRARAGKGPTLIEAITYRWLGHWQGDPCSYRTDKEVEEWQQKDGIARFREILLHNKILSKTEVVDIHHEVNNLVDKAQEYAINSPEPNEQELFADVYV